MFSSVGMHWILAEPAPVFSKRTLFLSHENGSRSLLRIFQAQHLRIYPLISQKVQFVVQGKCDFNRIGQKAWCCLIMLVSVTCLYGQGFLTPVPSIYPFPHKNVRTSWAPVGHTSNPNNSDGRDQEDHGLKPNQANGFLRPNLKKNLHKKGWCTNESNY
jgi:hypothetical protein